MTRYNTRTWLAPDHHSGASLHCFYDPENRNPDHVCFIRITDCTSAYILNRSLRQRKTFLRELEGILAVLKGNRKRFSITEGQHRYCFYYLHFLNTIWFNIGQFPSQKAIQLMNQKPKQKVLVRLHKDPETCDQDEWNQKIFLLISELEKFRTFLLGLEA